MSAHRLVDLDPSCIVELDVRGLLADGIKPLAAILAAAAALPAAHVLHVRSPFEPLPLHDLLRRQGFTFRSAAFARDDWSTWFWRSGETLPGATIEPTPATATPLGDDVLDLRQLAPPEPLLRLLERTGISDAPFQAAVPQLPELAVALLGDEGWVVERREPLADGGVLAWIRPADAVTPPDPAPAIRDRQSGPPERTPDRSTG